MSIKNKLTKNVFYCYFPIVVIFVLIKILSSFGLFSFLGTVGNYIVNVLIQIGLMFMIPVLLFSVFQKTKIKETFSFYGFKKMSFKAVIISILIGIIVYILNVFVATFFSTIISSFGYKTSSGTTTGNYPFWLLLINIVTTAVLPAICEETTHRGMLLKGLSPMGRTWAIIISSLLFGLLHLNIEQFFYATLIGILVGYISTICDTIYPAMIIHFMNNAISVLMGYSASNKLGFDFAFTWLNSNLQINPLLSIIFIVLLLATLVILLKYLIKLLFRETTMKNMNKLQNALFKEIQKDAYLKELEDLSKGNQDAKQNVTISFEEFDKLYQSKSVDLGQSTNLDNNIMSEFKPYKMDFITKLLMIASFVLTIAITIFSLIKGIL